MTVEQLLADLRRAGMILSANGHRLAFDAPAGVITPQLRAILAERKAELLAVLRNDYACAASVLLKGITDGRQRETLAYLFDEQAAIYEFYSEMSRDEAERHAYFDLATKLEQRDSKG